MLARSLDPDLEERNYAKQALTAEEIGALVDLAGVAGVLSTRNKTARAKGWNEAPPDRAAFIAACVAENNLLRRPIVVSGKRLVVGNDLDGIRELFAS